MPKIQTPDIKPQEVNSEEYKNIVKQNAWHDKVAVVNSNVQGDAKKAPVKPETK